MPSYLFEQYRVLCIGIFDSANIPDSLDKFTNLYKYSSVYRNAAGIDKYKRKLCEHGIGPYSMSRWYGHWTEKVTEADVILISDGIRGRDIIKYIHRKNPAARIIVYYSNSNIGHGRNDPSKYKDLPCELVTFDKKNADDYQITFKHYFYPYMEHRVYTSDSYCTQDIFFIGADKGRLNELLKWKNIFEHQGLTCKFMILKTKHKFYIRYRNEVMDRPVPYTEVVKEIQHSRAILDFTQAHQYGITYRPMEAMCFQKKLITNFDRITEYNFYNSDNIFRLSHDSIHDLKNFLDTPYVPIDDAIREEYVAATWLNSFFDNADSQ